MYIKFVPNYLFLFLFLIKVCLNFILRCFQMIPFTMSNKHLKLHSKHQSCRLFLHQPFKVNVPNMNTYLNWKPIFEWYVLGCGFKNKYQTNTCLNEIELCAQITVIVLSSIVYMIGGNYMIINDHKNLHFDND